MEGDREKCGLEEGVSKIPGGGVEEWVWSEGVGGIVEGEG